MNLKSSLKKQEQLAVYFFLDRNVEVKDEQKMFWQKHIIPIATEENFKYSLIHNVLLQRCLHFNEHYVFKLHFSVQKWRFHSCGKNKIISLSFYPIC